MLPVSRQTSLLSICSLFSSQCSFQDKNKMMPHPWLMLSVTCHRFWNNFFFSPGPTEIWSPPASRQSPLILPAGPSFFPRACQAHSRCRDFARIVSLHTRQLASSVFQVSSQKIISSERSSLTPEKPSPYSNPIILFSCEFLKCSCFLVYCLSSSTGRFFESITVFLAPTTVQRIDAQ